METPTRWYIANLLAYPPNRTYDDSKTLCFFEPDDESPEWVICWEYDNMPHEPIARIEWDDFGGHSDRAILRAADDVCEQIREAFADNPD